MIVVTLQPSEGRGEGRDTAMVWFVLDHNPKQKRILVVLRQLLATGVSAKVKIGSTAGSKLRMLRAGSPDSPWERFVAEAQGLGWQVCGMNDLNEHLASVFGSPEQDAGIFEQDEDEEDAA